MKFFIISLVIYLNILSLVKSVNENSESEFFQFKSSDDREQDRLGTNNLFEFEDFIKMIGSEYMEIFTAIECSFVINLRTKINNILNLYQSLMNENLAESKEIKNKIDPIKYDFDVSIKEYLESLSKQFENVGISESDNISKIKKPKSFSNTETIKESIETVRTVYDIVNGYIINSSINEELKRKLLWTVRNKTVLSALGIKIMFLNMVNNYSYLKKIKSGLIEPGIDYLLLFERGINQKISDTKTEEKTSFFNGFLENYESASEELIQRVISEIKENEVVLELNETTHKNFELMNKDLNKYIKPLITLNGSVIKRVSI